VKPSPTRESVVECSRTRDVALCMSPFGVVEGHGVGKVGCVVVAALVVALVVVDGHVSRVWWCAHEQWGVSTCTQTLVNGPCTAKQYINPTFLLLCLGTPTLYYSVNILYCIYYVLTCIVKDQLQPVATSLCAVYKYF
jgi:hypothetical protein